MTYFIKCAVNQQSKPWMQSPIDEGSLKLKSRVIIKTIQQEAVDDLFLQLRFTFATISNKAPKHKK